jgi:hypothetical protein
MRTACNPAPEAAIRGVSLSFLISDGQHGSLSSGADGNFAAGGHAGGRVWSM